MITLTEFDCCNLIEYCLNRMDSDDCRCDDLMRNIQQGYVDMLAEYETACLIRSENRKTLTDIIRIVANSRDSPLN